MTAYSTEGTFTLSGPSSTPYLSVTAVDFDIRVVRIDLAMSSSGGHSDATSRCEIFHFNSSTVSGGSTAFITRCRQGSAAPTAIAKTSATISGSTVSWLGAFGVGNYGYGSWTPPGEIIVSPGSTIAARVSGEVFTQEDEAFIYFEELRLSWRF